MIQIKEIVNSIFSSKTYIIYKARENKAWLVDIGDIEPVLSFLGEHYLTVEGVLLTHAHFDHIYGLESLLYHFPGCKVFVCEYAKQALASDKLNMSRYHGTPLSIESDRIIVVHDSDSLCLYNDEPLMYFYETPGHNPGCLTMVIGDKIFTGDAYIPGVGVNTRLPHADKEQAKVSLDRIFKLAEGKVILSGHQIERSKIE